MFVSCPHCAFMVATQAGNAVRCPRCGGNVDPRTAKPFAATPSPAVATAPADTDAGEPAPSEGTPADGTPADSTPADGTPADSASDTHLPAPALARASRMRPTPSFVRRRGPAPLRDTGWRSWLAIAGLIALLLLQVVLAQREALAANARWRPLVSGLCGVLRCQVPAWREPSSFTMLQRSVQPRRDMDGVLNVTASFRNDARWPQPWPTVLLTLSDMEGRQVGLRAFKPEEYRKGAADTPIAPGQSATIQLDVVEPARQVVAFTFDFQ